MPTRRAAKPPSTFIEPLLLAEQEKPPDGPGWVHEIKFDGYRVQAHLQDRNATACRRCSTARRRRWSMSTA